MKPDIEKLYERLTPRELAAMAFHYCATPDSGHELKKIENAVPYRDYRLRDISFRSAVAAYSEAATIWGLLHWQTRTRAAAASGSLLAVRALKGNKAVIRQTIHALWKYEGQLLALDKVLEELSKEHGLDPEDVRRLANTELYTPIIESDKLIPNPEFREEIHAMLSQMLSRLLPTKEQ